MKDKTIKTCRKVIIIMVRIGAVMGEGARKALWVAGRVLVLDLGVGHNGAFLMRVH